MSMITNPTALQMHEELCKMHRETVNTRLGDLEKIVEPLPVMASDLNVIKRLVGLIAVGMISTMFMFIWQVVLATHKGL